MGSSVCVVDQKDEKKEENTSTVKNNNICMQDKKDKKRDRNDINKRDLQVEDRETRNMLEGRIRGERSRNNQQRQSPEKCSLSTAKDRYETKDV